MINIARAFRTVIGFTYRIFPRAVAMVCVVSLMATAYDFYHESREQGVFKGHWVGCGNFQDIKSGVDAFNQNSLELRVSDAQPKKFLVSGSLSISQKTYLARIKDAERVVVELTPLQTKKNFFLPFPEIIDAAKAEDRLMVGERGVTLELKQKELWVIGGLEKYPFDQYRLGFSARVLIKSAKDYKYLPLVMDVVVVNVYLTNSFMAKKVERPEQFMIGLKSNMPETGHYESSQCSLIVERPLWYKAMVVFLLVLIFVPAVFLFYKRDADPGMELVAALLGVAAIRSYLLGIPTDWNLYQIDFIFAGAVMLTAVIPLWRLHKLDRNRSVK